MLKKIIVISWLVIISLGAFAQLKVYDLLTEDLTNPVGLGVLEPRFSWKLESTERNVLQTAYEIKVEWNGKLLWNSGKVKTEESIYIPYQGPALKSAAGYHWQVRVWDNKGKVSSWSKAAAFRLGLLNASDWKAKWIAPGFQEEAKRPSPVFQKGFNTGLKKISSATMFVTSRGLYAASLNSIKISEARFTPGWTSYGKRLQYQSYDVTSLLQEGANNIEVSLASGWYRGFVGFIRQNNVYGDQLALLMQLEIKYADGSSETVVSDGSWKCSTGKIRYSEILHGETIDNRVKTENWTDVREVAYPFDNLIASESEPVTAHERFKAIKILTTPKGEQVVDFGQNIAGFVRVLAKGNAGDTLIIEHAETLDKDGNFYTENLRLARQRNVYILNGRGEERFEPLFSFQGFRYIRLKGFRGKITPEQFEAVAIYSDTKRTGFFECSNPLLNQLQNNILWSQRGNFVDIPTDCPQRDERMGWLADAQLFSRTAMYNYGVKNFFGKWLKDLSADQFSSGLVPVSIPNIVGGMWAGAAAWSDAATIIPWNLYEAYGDKKILENQYASMKAWVSYMEKNTTGGLRNKSFQYGDWLSYAIFAASQPNNSAVTDPDMIAQMFYIRSVQIMAASAKILDKADDQAYYESLLAQITAVFRKEFVTPGGRLLSNTQTAYTLALTFDLLPDSLRSKAAVHLAKNVSSYGHVTTGLLGTPFINHALTKYGYADTAYKLLLNENYPSWLYPVKMGATTIWERWDGIRTDGTFQDPEMNSLNHYVYGSIGDWMYQHILGIQSAAPGYKKVVIRPVIGGGLTWAKGSYDSGYGKIGVSWRVKEDLELDVEIPCNTTAEIYVPDAEGKNWTKHLVGSGKYHFEGR